jgi:hypothetical protein
MFQRPTVERVIKKPRANSLRVEYMKKLLRFKSDIVGGNSLR